MRRYGSTSAKMQDGMQPPRAIDGVSLLACLGNMRVAYRVDARWAIVVRIGKSQQCKKPSDDTHPMIFKMRHPIPELRWNLGFGVASRFEGITVHEPCHGAPVNRPSIAPNII